jgi:peroxiredoxin
MVAVGDKVPLFRLQSSPSGAVDSHTLLGVSYVLHFYPLNFTPVCSSQVVLFNELLTDFYNAEVKVFGISVDSTSSHGAFREKLGILYPLLSDFYPHGEVSKAFGLFSEEYGVSERAVVVVDERGIICSVVASPLSEIPSLDDALNYAEARSRGISLDAIT